MWNRTTSIAASVIIAATLGACSLKLEIVLFNNAGQAVWAGNASAPDAIGPGLSGRVDYPQTNEHWVFRLRSKNCEFDYVVPRTLDDLDQVQRPSYANDGLKVQVESDFSLYVLPSDTTAIVSVSDLSVPQRNGFPLRPVTRHCK